MRALVHAMFVAAFVAATVAQERVPVVLRDLSLVQRLRVVCSDRHFGRVDDLVVELPSGRVVGVVVTMAAEAEPRTVLVPYDALQYEPPTNLLRLGRMIGRIDLEEKGVRMASSFSRKVAAFPAAFTQLLVAIDFILGPAHEVVIAGQPGAADTMRLVRALRTRFIPNMVVLFRPANEERPEVTELAPFTRAHAPVENRAAAFVCSNYACRMPTTDAEEMLGMLGMPAFEYSTAGLREGIAIELALGLLRRQPIVCLPSPRAAVA